MKITSKQPTVNLKRNSPAQAVTSVKTIGHVNKTAPIALTSEQTKQLEKNLKYMANLEDIGIKHFVASQKALHKKK